MSQKILRYDIDEYIDALEEVTEAAHELVWKPIAFYRDEEGEIYRQPQFARLAGALSRIWFEEGKKLKVLKSRP